MSGIFQEILILLKDNQVVDTDTKLDDFVNLIYKPGEQRMEILSWMITKLSDGYGNYLQKSEEAETSVALKLSALQFVKKSDKMAFVLGKLPVKQQEEVFSKIFKSLFKIQFLQRHRKQDHSFKENFKTEPRVMKACAKKGKTIKPFDFNAARKRIKDVNVKKSVQCLDSLKKVIQLIIEPQPQSNDNDTPEIDNLKTEYCAFDSSLELLSSYSCGVSERVEAELDTSAIAQLYSVLLAFNQAPEKHHENLGISRKRDCRKPIEDINDLRKTSVILQLNKLYNLAVK